MVISVVAIFFHLINICEQLSTIENCHPLTMAKGRLNDILLFQHVFYPYPATQFGIFTAGAIVYMNQVHEAFSHG